MRNLPAVIPKKKMNQEQERHGAKSNYFSEPEDTRL
jgi:hypothetical protein